MDRSPFGHRMEPSLVSRIYNGLDERKGYRIVLTKPIVPVVAPARRPWWRKVFGL